MLSSIDEFHLSTAGLVDVKQAVLRSVKVSHN